VTHSCATAADSTELSSSHKVVFKVDTNGEMSALVLSIIKEAKTA